MDIVSYLLGKKSGGGGDPHEAEYTAAAYGVCEDKGAEMPEEQTLENLADCIDTIPGAEVIPPDAGTLESIVVGTPPTKTTYTEGDALDLTGCVILGNFSNGYQYDVTQRCAFTCNDPVTFSDTKIVVSFTYMGTTKTLNISITVNGAQVQAPAETVGLWHFDQNTDKNEVNGKGTWTNGLCDPQGIWAVPGKWSVGTYGRTTNDGYWINYNNSLALAKYQYGHLGDMDFTFEFWGYTETSVGTDARFTLFMSDATNASMDLKFQINSSYAFTVPSSYWLPNPVKVKSKTLAAGKWHHFAFVWNHATQKVFVDGELCYTGSGVPSQSQCTLRYVRLYSTYTAKLWYDEVLFTMNAKYSADFEPSHGPYYLAQGGE